jgi:hypothetical protein
VLRARHRSRHAVHRRRRRLSRPHRLHARSGTARAEAGDPAAAAGRRARARTGAAAGHPQARRYRHWIRCRRCRRTPGSPAGGAEHEQQPAVPVQRTDEVLLRLRHTDYIVRATEMVFGSVSAVAPLRAPMRSSRTSQHAGWPATGPAPVMSIPASSPTAAQSLKDILLRIGTRQPHCRSRFFEGPHGSAGERSAVYPESWRSSHPVALSKLLPFQDLRE